MGEDEAAEGMCSRIDFRVRRWCSVTPICGRWRAGWRLILFTVVDWVHLEQEKIFGSCRKVGGYE